MWLHMTIVCNNMYQCLVFCSLEEYLIMEAAVSLSFAPVNLIMCCCTRPSRWGLLCCVNWTDDPFFFFLIQPIQYKISFTFIYV